MQGWGFATASIVFPQSPSRGGGAENTSTGKRKYGKGKYETAHFARMENASTENASTNLQGWKTQVGPTENASTMQTFSQIKKKFGTPGSAPGPTLGNEYGKTLAFFTSQVSVVHFQVGWASGLQIVFF